MTESPSKTIGQGPKTRICYLCGRQYGINSYHIHLKQCKELWIAREALKEPKDRKKLPDEPLASVVNPSTEKNSTDTPAIVELDIEALNLAASTTYKNESLESCAFCGRTFLAEKLLVHHKSCTADTPARRANETVRRGNNLNKILSANNIRPHTSSAMAQCEAKSTLPVKHERKSVRDSLELKNETQAIDLSTTHLKLADGTMVGHLGGPSGRGLRKPSVSDQPVADVRNKIEIMEHIWSRLEILESNATALLNSVKEIKQLVGLLNQDS